MHTVVLTRNRFLHASRRIIAAAQRAGHTVSVVDPLAASLGIDGANYPVRSSSGVLASADIVIGRTSPLTRDAVLSLLRQYEQRGPVVVSRSAAMATACDKFATLQVLAGIGVPVPRTWLLRTDAELETALEAVGGAPLVLKAPDGARGRGVALAESIGGARSTAQALLDADQPLLVQEYFAECRGVDVRAMVIGDQVVAAARRHGRSDDFRANAHCGGTLDAIDLDPAVARMAVASVEAIGLEYAGVDILETKRGPVVIEVNATPGLRGIEEATNRDIAGMLIAHASALVAEDEMIGKP